MMSHWGDGHLQKKNHQITAGSPPPPPCRAPQLQRLWPRRVVGRRVGGHRDVAGDEAQQVMRQAPTCENHGKPDENHRNMVGKA